MSVGSPAQSEQYHRQESDGIIVYIPKKKEAAMTGIEISLSGFWIFKQLTAKGLTG